MRIGINSGEIVTGNMGSASRMNYTMMGDSVNLAARLEESAKQYGIFTQVAKETVEMTGDTFVWRELDTIKVVGKSVPVTSYDLFAPTNECPDFLKKLSVRFKEGIEAYKEYVIKTNPAAAKQFMTQKTAKKVTRKTANKIPETPKISEQLPKQKAAEPLNSTKHNAQKKITPKQKPKNTEES